MKKNCLSDKIILDLCGGTGAWSKPYKEAGYTVYNITLPKYNVQDCILYGNRFLIFWRQPIKNKFHDDYRKEDIQIPVEKIYGILAAPPCTEFSLAAWDKKKTDRDFKKAFGIVQACLDIIWAVQEQGIPLKFWALENPKGYLYNFLGYPTFYFQPWQFGETDFRATKRTAIWGYFKKPRKTCQVRKIPFINAHSQSKGQKPENKEWYSKKREDRAITPPGFAQAFFEANR